MTTILYAELIDVDSFVWILMKPQMKESSHC